MVVELRCRACGWAKPFDPNTSAYMLRVWTLDHKCGAKGVEQAWKV